jgi:hypothetical protein
MSSKSKRSLVEECIDFALEKRDAGGSSLPLPEFIELTSPKSFSFWWQAAEELHRRNLPFEAIDFWQRAVRDAPAQDRCAVLEDMAETLWAAGDFGRDEYLTEQSLESLRKGELWEKLAHRLTEIERPHAEILNAIECALLEKKVLDVPIDIGEWQQIEDWPSLGSYYAAQGNFPKALDAYSKAFTSTDDANSLLRTIIRDLTYCANDREIDLNDDE